MNECVSWTVDIPVAELPDLPPLPSGIQEKFDDVLARTALQQPTWDQKQADTVRKILESVPPIVVTAGRCCVGPRVPPSRRGLRGDV